MILPLILLVLLSGLSGAVPLTSQAAAEAAATAEKMTTVATMANEVTATETTTTTAAATTAATATTVAAMTANTTTTMMATATAATATMTISETTTIATTTNATATNSTTTNATNTTSSPPPGPSSQCLKDGYVHDAGNCAKFYECLGGMATLRTCPYGLFFNNATGFCDWANKVSCELTEQQVLDQLILPSPVYLYLTLDDSPGEGTNETLDALKEEGDVPSTFFVNLLNMEPGKDGVHGRETMVLRMIKEGHTVADHSYNHMAHKFGGRDGIYGKDVDDDLRYFGQMGLTPLVALMEREGLPNSDVDRVSSTFTGYARFPFTNHWRVTGRFRGDCQSCTTPVTSSYYSRLVADKLEEEKGTQVIGWDIEWHTDWTSYRYQKGAIGMLMEMSSTSTKMKGKLVLLTHSFMHERKKRDFELREFKTFLRLAKKIGYRFKTVDTYIEDVVVVSE